MPGGQGLRGDGHGLPRQHAGPNEAHRATVRFQNKANRPLVLGYVQESGIITDDQGNRYVVYGNGSVRGIGEISRSTFDPKFVLQPGESSDARFEFVWRPSSANQIIGTAFQIDLAIREIDPVTGNQFRLGREHALHFRGLGETAITAGAASAMTAPSRASSPAATQAPAEPAAAASAPVADACGAMPRCHSAGPFVAELAQLTASKVGNFNDHVLRMQVRFRNVTPQPLILGYRATSGVAIDNYGNRYAWGRPGTHDLSASGIGTVESIKADPQFVLNPGESRSATFQLIRYRPGQSPIGTVFTYDLTLEQLEVLPGNQVRSLRQYAVGFKDLTAATGDAVQATRDAAAQDVGKKVLDELRKKLKKP